MTMAKFVRSLKISLNANESKTVEQFVGKSDEKIILKNITFSSTGGARLVVYKNQTLMVDVINDFVPDVNHRIDLELEADAGDEIVIQVEDTSGASNTVMVYYEYERISRA